MKKKIYSLIGGILIFIAIAICFVNGFYLKKHEEYQEEIKNISSTESQTLETNQEGDEEEFKVNEEQKSEVENRSENVEIQNKEEIVEENTSTQTTSNKEKSTKVNTNSNEKGKVEKTTDDKKTENKKTEDKNTQEVLNKSNISTSTKNVETNGTENKQAAEKKIDLSKYLYYEKQSDGSYKAYMEDETELYNVKVLIDDVIKKFGYKNVKIEPDSSLVKDRKSYFTANRINVETAIYDCEGFNIYYYAAKEYCISPNGTEKYFQTRSYIKVK